MNEIPIFRDVDPGVLNVLCRDSTDDLSQVISVTNVASAIALYRVNDQLQFEMPALGGFVEIYVESNVDYSFKIDEASSSWIKCIPNYRSRNVVREKSVLVSFRA